VCIGVIESVCAYTLIPNNRGRVCIGIIERVYVCVYTPMVIIECVIESVCVIEREYVCVYTPMVIEGMYRYNRVCMRCILVSGLLVCNSLHSECVRVAGVQYVYTVNC